MTRCTRTSALRILTTVLVLSMISATAGMWLQLHAARHGHGLGRIGVGGAAFCWSGIVGLNILYYLWSVYRLKTNLVPLPLAGRSALFLIAFTAVPAIWLALPFVSGAQAWQVILVVYIGGTVVIGSCWWYVWSMRHLRRTFQRIRAGLPTCHYCGYDLTANQSNRCPECGEAVTDQAAT